MNVWAGCTDAFDTLVFHRTGFYNLKKIFFNWAVEQQIWWKGGETLSTMKAETMFVLSIPVCLDLSSCNWVECSIDVEWMRERYIVNESGEGLRIKHKWPKSTQQALRNNRISLIKSCL